MGYDIHITRQENWYDDDASKEISLQEWKEYIEADADMRLDGFAEAALQSGDKIRLENEGLAVWTKYPGEDTAWFDLKNGNIAVKNPDEAIMRKMLEIAGQLNAKMQGDDGEIYDLADEILETAPVLTGLQSITKKPWWKFW